MASSNYLGKEEIQYFFQGGFAQTVDLLKEFDFKKIGIVLDGLHFSAFSLLKHMDARQEVLLQFIQQPDSVEDLWHEAHWPTNYSPKDEKEWENAIQKFQNDLQEMAELIFLKRDTLFHEQKNGKSLFWAAMTNLQHNSYHIGQLKTIGRQLGVW